MTSIEQHKVPGTREHAEAMAQGRHPGVRDALQWLTFAHLPESLQRYSRPFYETAVILIVTIKTDSPELTTALNGLISAKDSAVRAGIRHDTGRAGSVPRSQSVVLPPSPFAPSQEALAAIKELGES
jgi:nicotinic acid phosphoribosyltransferase